MDESGGARARPRRPRPIAFARDAKRAVGALARDSLALSRKMRAVRELVAPEPPLTRGERAARTAVGRVLAIARKPRHGAPMEPIDAASITPERGLAGNANGRPGRRQLTVLTREGWGAACRDLGREVPWTTRRANVLVEGLELAGRVGWRLTIGEVMLEITGETTPCSRMDAQVAGLTAALAAGWRAGVTCRVLQGGEIGRGDAVTLEPP